MTHFVPVVMVMACLGAATCLGVDFDANGKWGVVKTDAYEAVVDRNGSFVLTFKGAELKLKASYREGWTPLSFPSIKMMEASKSEDASKVQLEFRCLWHVGEMQERLTFDCRSVEASYCFKTAFQGKRSLGFHLCALEPLGPTGKDLKMDVQLAEDSIEVFTASTAFQKRRFMTASFPVGGNLRLAAITGGDCYFEFWNFPALTLRNGTVWKRKFNEGDELPLTYLLHIASDDGKGLPDSKVVFLDGSSGEISREGGSR